MGMCANPATQRPGRLIAHKGSGRLSLEPAASSMSHGRRIVSGASRAKGLAAIKHPEFLLVGNSTDERTLCMLGDVEHLLRDRHDERYNLIVTPVTDR